ncbi:hypothetical protein Taro_018962, partial [Colocasia esculenta]|nr:hypothetical protein [Colocasia esculenta]
MYEQVFGDLEKPAPEGNKRGRTGGVVVVVVGIFFHRYLGTQNLLEICLQSLKGGPSAADSLLNNEGRCYRAPPNVPVRFHPSYSIAFGSDKK